jgi:nuclear transport factor 2 (NTF2) superfamily protein
LADESIAPADPDAPQAANWSLHVPQPPEPRSPRPPFTRESAVLKVRKAEDAWNSREPIRVAGGYTLDSRWRNRSEFLQGRPAIIAFLTRKWIKEREYRLTKELWAYTEDRLSVRFAYEWCDAGGVWYRSYGNENWGFGEDGLMRERHASINDVEIKAEDRLFHWDRSGPRPAEAQSLTDLGF